jgi:hypothetical protein
MLWVGRLQWNSALVFKFHLTTFSEAQQIIGRSTIKNSQGYGTKRSWPNVTYYPSFVSRGLERLNHTQDLGPWN